MSHFTRSDSTSWERSSDWYNKIVDKKGHYYHQAIVIPGVLKLLHLDNNSSLLDIACGQGVLARNIPKEVKYLGIDISKQLIDSARKYSSSPLQSFHVADGTRSIPTKDRFTHAAIILALQNIKHPIKTIQLAGERLNPGGKLVIVLNHPCFRIPRQSSWEMDLQNKTQFRRVNRYLSPLEIPLTTHPGEKYSPVTWSFHHPLSDYSTYLYSNGFLIEKIEEWASDKESIGKAARMENRAREEFPLFMAISAIKR